MAEPVKDPARIAARIARALGDEGLVERLVTLPQSDLTSLLLEVFRRRSVRRTPAELLAQYQRGGPPLPSPTDPRLTAEIERHAFAAAADFEALALSPVAPLGLNVVLGNIDQNCTLGALRGLEVMADPTTALALECVRRRQAGAGEVRLCAAARMLRLQPLDNPTYSRHFAIFALVTAGRDPGGGAFELGTLDQHLRVHLDVLRRLTGAGYRFDDLRVDITDTTRNEARLAQVEAQLFPALRRDFPAVSFAFDRERTHAMSYYGGLCLHLGARDRGGTVHQISDGGLTSWTQRLTSNAKERLLVSGFGSELMIRAFAVG